MLLVTFLASSAKLLTKTPMLRSYSPGKNKCYHPNHAVEMTSAAQLNQAAEIELRCLAVLLTVEFSRIDHIGQSSLRFSPLPGL